MEGHTRTHRIAAGELPRWLTGDWGRIIRDPLDLMRLALLVGAAVTLLVGPREQSLRLLLSFGLVLIPRALDVPRPFDLAFIAGIWFQAWGNVFGAFDGVYGYDKLVHFVLPCALSVLLYLGLVRFRVVPDLAAETGLHERAGILLVTCVFGLALGGGLYEMYEWFADRYLGAHLYTSYGDSIGDLVDDGLGALCGGALILAWDSCGWGTRRRARPVGGAVDDPVADAGRRVVERLTPEPDAGRRARRDPALPAWLIGDWSRTLRGPGDLLRVALAAGIVVAAVSVEPALAARFALTLAAALIVRTLDMPRPFDLAFTAAMAVQAWGAMAGAFGSIGGYDGAVHTVVSAATVPVVYIALVRLRLVPDLSDRTRLHQAAGIALIGFCGGFAAGISYEVYLYALDQLTGVRSVQYDDLIRRLGLDALGALAGTMLLVLWDRRGWPSRRAPAGALRASRRRRPAAPSG
jgi:hypothetical protein